MLNILFDLDRTLWDFDVNADRTYRAMFDLFGLEQLCHVDYQAFHSRYCQINDMLWEAYRQGTLSKEHLSLRRFSFTLADFGCDPESPDIIRLSLKMADYYVVEGTRQSGLMPGAKKLMEWLSSRRDSYRMAVITNGFSEAQLPKMRHSGIDSFFDYVFLSEDVGYMKPDRRFFDVAMKKMKAGPDDCLVVGDDYMVDIMGAMNAGIPQVWYNYASHELAEGQPKPTYTISHLLQLREILR